MKHLVRHRIFLLSIVGIILSSSLWGKAERFRAILRDNPASSIIIGWDQVSGENAVLYYSMIDLHGEVEKFPYKAELSKSSNFKGMTNNFVHLQGLVPNTVYYFVVKDSEGPSKQRSFRTLPARNDKLSIIAGGDSRNHREVRIQANKLVAKLRPHCVFFSGDMTNGDTDNEWSEWLDDWQYTTSADGRMTPIVVARGNHEKSNQTLYELFYLPSEDNVYSIQFGKNLLYLLNLNSLIAPGGNQKLWIDKELSRSQNHYWRIAQYHFSMRPHNARKPENFEQSDAWGPLFAKHRLDLALESDVHLCKITKPIIYDPSSESDEGFREDAHRGTVYIGEGGWGAPLRANNDDKIWTVKSGSFNQFKWIFVSQSSIEVRTILIDSYPDVVTLSDRNRFSIPIGLRFWNVDGLEEYTMNNERATNESTSEEIELLSFNASPTSEGMKVSWEASHEQSAMSYLLERSINGADYMKVGRQNARNESAVSSYTIVDALNYYGEISYRLKLNHVALRTEKMLAEKSFLRDKPEVVTIKENIVIDATKPGRLIHYSTPYEGTIGIVLANSDLRVIEKKELPKVEKGDHSYLLNIESLTAGAHTLLIRLDEELLMKVSILIK